MYAVRHYMPCTLHERERKKKFDSETPLFFVFCAFFCTDFEYSAETQKTLEDGISRLMLLSSLLLQYYRTLTKKVKQ